MNRYVFRNALLPQITALILTLGTIFNGALLTEMIFAYPGIGPADAYGSGCRRLQPAVRDHHHDHHRGVHGRASSSTSCTRCSIRGLG